jgi:hypothetical protein
MVVGTVSSAGLPPGWQEVQAEGQVYYWCVCLFFFFFFSFCARAPTFFSKELDYFLFSLSLTLSLSVRGTFSRRDQDGARDRRNEH